VGLMTFVVSLPLAPVRGVIALGRLVQEQVEQELHAPSSVRRDLEAAAEAREAGEITADEEAAVQRRALERVAEPTTAEPPEG
jgi:phosphate uptake regulator